MSPRILTSILFGLVQARHAHDLADSSRLMKQGRLERFERNGSETVNTTAHTVERLRVKLNPRGPLDQASTRRGLLTRLRTVAAPAFRGRRPRLRAVALGLEADPLIHKRHRSAPLTFRNQARFFAFLVQGKLRGGHAAHRGRIAMFKIVGTLPVKTRLPLVAWVLAGLVTLFSLVTS